MPKYTFGGRGRFQSLYLADVGGGHGDLPGESGNYSMKFSKSIQKKLAEVQKILCRRIPEAGMIVRFLETYQGKHGMLQTALPGKPCIMNMRSRNAGRSTDINDIMNSVVTGWRYFSNPRAFTGP